MKKYALIEADENIIPAIQVIVDDEKTIIALYESSNYEYRKIITLDMLEKISSFLENLP